MTVPMQADSVSSLRQVFTAPVSHHLSSPIDRVGSGDCSRSFEVETDAAQTLRSCGNGDMKRSSPRILVVDDEPHLRSALKTLLEGEGFIVFTAPDGETALTMSREKSPDVVLLDLVIPEPDGREVCRQIRQFSNAIRIVYFTGTMEAYQPNTQKQLLAEADALIVKPAGKRQILAGIRKVLEVNRQ